MFTPAIQGVCESSRSKSSQHLRFPPRKRRRLHSSDLLHACLRAQELLSDSDRAPHSAKAVRVERFGLLCQCLNGFFSKGTSCFENLFKKTVFIISRYTYKKWGFNTNDLTNTNWMGKGIWSLYPINLYKFGDSAIMQIQHDSALWNQTWQYVCWYVDMSSSTWHRLVRTESPLGLSLCLMFLSYILWVKAPCFINVDGQNILNNFITIAANPRLTCSYCSYCMLLL